MKTPLRLKIAACGCLALTLLSADAPLKLKKVIVGKWETASIRIELGTMKDPTQPNLVEANTENFAEKMRMQPPRAEYRRDGSFTSAYIGLEGKVILEVNGTYTVEENRLLLGSDNKHYDGLEYKCRVLDADAFEYVTYIDYDNDGERDDKLTGTARRLK